MKKPCLWHYALAFLLSVAAALALLLFSALLPQGPSSRSLRQSCEKPCLPVVSSMGMSFFAKSNYSQ